MIEAKPNKFHDLPVHETIFRYVKADWVSFRSYMMEAPLPTFLNYNASKKKKTAFVTDWILSEIELFIHQNKFQQKPKSQTCFSTECATARIHRKPQFHNRLKNVPENA